MAGRRKRSDLDTVDAKVVSRPGTRNLSPKKGRISPKKGPREDVIQTTVIRHNSVSHRAGADTVTPAQYKLGWDYVSTRQPVVSIVAASGMTSTQLKYLMTNPLPGYERKCPSYAQRWVELIHKLRKRTDEAAEVVGSGALEALKREVDTVKTSQQIVKLILSDIGHNVAMNMKLPREERKNMDDILPGKKTVDMLNALRKHSDFSVASKAFKDIFETPTQQVDPLTAMPKGSTVGLNPDTIVPAVLALMSDSSTKTDEDVVDTLLPEFKEWSEEEVQEYLTNFNRPDRDYTPSDDEAESES